MKALVIKDLLLLKKYLRPLFGVLIFYFIIGFITNNISFFASFLTIVLAMTSTTSFAYDETAKWDSFAMTMPIKKRSIVQSKYIVSGMLVLLGFILGGLLIVTSVFTNETEDIKQSFLSLLVFFIVGMIYAAVTLPITAKYGTEKARFVLLPLIIIPAGIVLIIEKLGFMEKAIQFIQIIKPILPYIGVAAVIIIWVVSYFIYLKIYTKKEW